MASRHEAGIIHTDIPQRLDRLPWSRWHTLIVLALGVTWILDGLEVTIIGAIAPMLTRPGTLHLTEGELGLTATSYLLGTVSGAFIFSYLTDLQGRKKWFLITLLVYLTATFLTAFSWDLWSFMLCRFVAGMGIGGEYSAINSAIDELIPARTRGHTDLAINGSWWFGTLCGALLSIPLLDTTLFAEDLGWRICFALGALLGLAILFVRRWVPESPRWLVTHGRIIEAENIVETVEKQIINKLPRGTFLPEPSGSMQLRPGQHVNILTVARQLLKIYPQRTILGLVLMTTQSCLYNAIFFSYAMILHVFYDVPEHKIGGYIIPFAIANLMGPLLLGRFFDTIGRRVMIGLTYGLSGILLLITSFWFLDGRLDPIGQTVCWSLVFFFASAGASSAYLTVSEIFPLEIRAMSIAFFFIVAQGVASVTPWIFGMLIQNSRWDLFMGNAIAAVIMIIGAVIGYVYGVNAERRPLEEIARPLSAKD